MLFDSEGVAAFERKRIPTYKNQPTADKEVVGCFFHIELNETVKGNTTMNGV